MLVVSWIIVSVPGEASGNVLISYVRGDAHHVGRLQHALEAAGILVWRDTADLWPGQDWQASIRRAINVSALVFLAFSQLGTSLSMSCQDEELLPAIDHLRQRSPDDSRLMPARFDSCEIPDGDLGGGRALRSIRQAGLSGDGAGNAMELLVAAIRGVLGRGRGGVVAAEGPAEPRLGRLVSCTTPGHGVRA